jgi:AAHS family benzoate transporter-like MFS transporter
MPAALDARARNVLAMLAVVAAGTGFQGSIPSASLTYAAREWGNSTAQQTQALAAIRTDIVIAVFLTRLADRVGRRRMLLVTATASPLLTALCALAPSLSVFAALQIVSRSFVTCTGILIAVIVVEEVPATARAWSSGVLVFMAALGTGVAVASVAIADRGVRVWRLLYLLPLLTLVVMPLVRRRLPETARFVRALGGSSGNDGAHPTRGVGSMARQIVAGARRHRRRLLLVGTFVFLLAFENTPTRQLQNEYLRVDRAFSSRAVAVFSVLTNAPGLIGLALGSGIGDRFGHKLGGACLGFGACDAGVFLSHGAAIWWWSVAGALLGAASLPILGMLTAQLFPTSFRSTANGLTTTASRLGGALGLLLVGALTHLWSRGTSIALTTLSIGLALLLLPFLPDSTGRELEDLNPDDRPSP